MREREGERNKRASYDRASCRIRSRVVERRRHPGGRFHTITVLYPTNIPPFARCGCSSRERIARRSFARVDLACRHGCARTDTRPRTRVKLRQVARLVPLRLRGSSTSSSSRGDASLVGRIALAEGDRRGAPRGKERYARVPTDVPTCVCYVYLCVHRYVYKCMHVARVCACAGERKPQRAPE